MFSRSAAQSSSSASSTSNSGTASSSRTRTSASQFFQNMGNAAASAFSGMNSPRRQQNQHHTQQQNQSQRQQQQHSPARAQPRANNQPQHNQWRWQPQQDAAPRADGPPPASAAALAALPNVDVTEEDMKDEANSTCCVCIDDFSLGERVTRLPCGHLLHKPCAQSWLLRHCTCPVCRYELHTNDSAFERGRHVRMAEQRPRYRLEALERKGVHELRRLASAVGVNVRGCIEKQDLVERIATSGRIEVIGLQPPASSSSPGHGSSSPSARGAGHSSPAPGERVGVGGGGGGGGVGAPGSSVEAMRRSDVARMGVGALRRLMISLQLDPSLCLEKGDMVTAIVESGLVTILPEHNEEAGGGGGSTLSPSTSGTTGSSSGGEELTLETLASMGVAQLKALMEQVGVSSEECVEKADMVQRLLSSGRVQIVTSSSSVGSRGGGCEGEGGGGVGGGGAAEEEETAEDRDSLAEALAQVEAAIAREALERGQVGNLPEAPPPTTTHDSSASEGEGTALAAAVNSLALELVAGIESGPAGLAGAEASGDVVTVPVKNAEAQAVVASIDGKFRVAEDVGCQAASARSEEKPTEAAETEKEAAPHGESPEAVEEAEPHQATNEDAGTGVGGSSP